MGATVWGTDEALRVQAGLTDTLGVWLSQGRFEETGMASVFIHNECAVLSS